jgi:hypothetical protein
MAVMKNQPRVHFERAGKHLQEALTPIQDALCQTSGIAGLLIIVCNGCALAERGPHSFTQSKEWLEIFLLGLTLLAVGAGRLAFRRWTGRRNR